MNPQAQNWGLKPGDQVTCESGAKFTIQGPVSYQGKADCVDPQCTLRWDGDRPIPGCLGYHCAICDKPSGMTGHKACRDELEAAESDAH